MAHLQNLSGVGFGAEAKSLLKQALLLGTAYLLVAASAQAASLPTGGHYVAGQGSISKASQSLTVKQSSTTGIIDWGTFSVGRNNAVTFDNGNGATLNRVTGGNLSTIAGSLHATGSLYLMNSQGVIVSGTGRVTTGGNFVATSGSLSNSAFQDNRFNVTNFKGAVVNRGTIVSGGVARLAGADVRDSGHISASAVSLDAVSSLTVNGAIVARNADGSGGVIVATAKHVALGADANLSASGTSGGTVLIGGDVHGGAVAADNFVDYRVRDASTTSIAQGAQISADASKTTGGNIVIWSDGHTSFDGKLSARGQTGGGFAEVSSHGLLGFGGQVDLTAQFGKTGTLLLDPYDVVVSDDSQATETDSGGTFNPSGNTSIINVKTLETALKSTNVEITTGSSGTQEGNISIIAPLTWATNSTLVLDAANSVIIDAPIKITNVGGLVVDYNTSTGSFDPIDGVGSVTFSHPDSSLLAINGTTYTLEDSLDDMARDMAVAPDGHYAMANNFGSETFSQSVIPETFTGTLEGLGNTISGLNISDGGDSESGLFSEIGTGGVVRDILLAAPSVFNSEAGGVNVGALAGINRGTVVSVEVVGGSVSASTSITEASVGGLLGASFGTVSSSSASAVVTGGNSDIIGGLVGAVEGGTISRSEASGAVSGGLLSDIGGLVGENYATITASYATGSVTGANETSDGGFVGNNTTTGTISDSYESGAVTSGTLSNVGGLVASNYGSINGTYALGNVTSGGTSTVGGLAGYNGGGTIAASYSVGAVGSTGTGDQIGGSVGQNAATLTGVYFDTNTPGTKSVGSGTFTGVGEGSGTGVTGLTSAEMRTSSKMPGLTFGTTPGTDGFVITDLNETLNNASGAPGGTLPILLSEASPNTDVHIVTDAHQLELIGLDPGATYVIANNIDMSGTSTGKDVWIASSGFIGAGGLTGFTGNIFGSGFAINGLFEDNSSNVADIGLLARAKGGLFENLTLSNIDLVGTGDQDQIGGLVGISIDAGGSFVSVSNVSVSGNISDTSTYVAASGNASVGGLAGMTYGNYTNDSSSVAVTTSGTTAAGGLIGNQTGGAIASSHASGAIVGGSGDISAAALPFVGGLIGTSVGTVTGSYATGNISTTGYGAAGGLMGQNGGNVDTSYATGNVSSAESFAGGGLIGVVGAPVTTSYATGSVTGGTGSVVGGFAAEINAEVQNSYATGSVTTASNGLAGGFTGISDANIFYSFATGAVKGGSAAVVGGFVGENTNDIVNSYALGSATGDKATTGGFVGLNADTATVTSSYAAGAVKAGGGFVGENVNTDSNAIQESYWDTQTTGQSNGATTGGGTLPSGSLVGLTTAKLEAALPAGLGDVDWDIVAKTSLPYLRWQAPTGTPEVISGMISGSGNVGVGVDVLVNGKLVTPLDGMASGANGFYYELLAPGTIASSGSDVLAYEATGNANAFMQAANGSLTGVDLTADTLTVDSSAASATSLLAALKKAVGSHQGGELLYTKKGGFTSGTDLDLNLDAAAFSLNRGFNVGTGEVDIDAAGSINETKKGAIKAKTLTGQTDGAASFGSTKNVVADLGAFTTGGNHNFTLLDDSDLTTTGTLNAGANDVVLATRGSGHDIAVDAEIAAQELKLVSAATISESTAGGIDVTALTGSSAGAASLTSADNTIANLNVFTSGGAFALTDAQSLVVKGAVNVGSNTVDLTTTGSGSNLAIDAKLTGGTINLVTTGEATESSAGAIDANLLNVTAATGIDLASKKNAIQAVGTDKTTTGPNTIKL